MNDEVIRDVRATAGIDRVVLDQHQQVEALARGDFADHGKFRRVGGRRVEKDVAVRVLIDGLRELSLLSGTVEQILASRTFRRFYMHRTGHWLGMDVHDVGAYFVQGGPPNEHRRLEPGMVVTVEPGLYFAEDDATIPAEYRAIGVRIEDDVLVTTSGNEVLTRACPKEIADLEALVGSAGRAAAG